MFLNNPKNPTKLKETIYLLASIVLGLILSFLFHAFIEMIYLAWADANGVIVVFYGGCALHPVLRHSLTIAGIIGGFFLGRYWWRKVYIERVWEKR